MHKKTKSYKKWLFFIALMSLFVSGCGLGHAPKLSVDNASKITQISSLAGHTASINNVVFSPDGTLLASGDATSSMRLWDVKQQKELTVLEGPTGNVADMAFYPDGTTIVAITSNWTDDEGFQKLRLWNVKTYEEVSAPANIGQAEATTDVKPSSTLAISPDGTLLALNTCGGKVRLDPSGNILCEFSGVRLLDADTGDSVAELPQNFDAMVWRMAFSPDGNLLAASSGDGTVRLFDVQAATEQSTLLQSESRAFGIAFSSDGKTLAAGLGDSTVRIFNIATAQEMVVLRGHTEPVICVAFSPDGSLLASGSVDKKIRVWNTATGELLTTLEGHTDYVISIAFSPDGSQIASGSYDKTVRLWGLP